MKESAIGAYIRRVREGRGLSQDDLAALLNVPSRNIGRWERGENEPKSLALLDLLNAIQGSADDTQALAGNPDVTDEDGIAMADELLRQRPGKIEIQRSTAVYHNEV